MSFEMEHLGLANKHIREARQRIARQELLVRQLADSGHDTCLAEAILQTFRDTLSAFRDHRKLIVDEMASEDEIW